MKILTAVSVRPQFIKIGVVSKKLRKNAQEILVLQVNIIILICLIFSGNLIYQHLIISGGSHQSMTGRMLIGLEKRMVEENPIKF